MSNGLMVRGKEEIKKIGFSVSASISLFGKAKKENCDCIIVHHTFNFPPTNRFDAIFQNRYSFLTQNHISLFGFHFLLDAHPEIGNNARILKIIGAKPTKPFLHRGDPWGYMGEFTEPKSMDAIRKDFKEYESRRTVFYDFGPKEIRKVVGVSGKGSPYAGDMQQLIDENIDLYITGEVHEWIRELFKEAKINFLAAGHYMTETIGIKSLMKKISEDFPDTQTQWLDVTNDI